MKVNRATPRIRRGFFFCVAPPPPNSTRGWSPNWLVCVATVCGMSSSSTLGKIAACWFPVFMFFIHGFEHAVLNMFLLYRGPAGVLIGLGPNTEHTGIICASLEEDGG